MKFDVIEGWLKQAIRRPSPNCDLRPAGCDVDLLVIHGISLPPGEFAGNWIDDFFCNCLDSDVHPFFQSISGLKVSSHILIRRDGEVVQYVPFFLRAWHAGESSYQGRTRCNDFSIGIELEGCDDQPYQQVQYLVLSGIARALMAEYPKLSPTRIAGHSDISPGRKTDPGPCFDWTRLRLLLDQAE